jgi:hypothetical protein
MNIKRRDFIAVSGTALALLLASLPNVMRHDKADGVGNPVNSAAHIEKSIKANFGAGFCVRAQTQRMDSVYAEIEHAGNRYIVVSSDLVDWNIVSSDLV